MARTKTSTMQKALSMNRDMNIYGTFAEIGAGQEVARLFFQAGSASGTVAKTMSAYDMKFSDAIYGREKSGRYVCQSRLEKMMNHEFKLLIERLDQYRGDSTHFFAYANTVTTSGRNNQNGHGWMGIRFLTEPRGKTNQIVLHVNLLDNTNFQQQEALSVLGVNLIYAAFHYYDRPATLIDSLKDNLHLDRFKIDMIDVDGPDLKHLDPRLLCLQLVEKGFTSAVMFDNKGCAVQPLDYLFRKSVLLQRGTFRPVTKNHLHVRKIALRRLKQDFPSENPVAFMELTMQNLKKWGNIDTTDFLTRIDLLSAVGCPVLVTNFVLFYEIIEYLRGLTDRPAALSISGMHLHKMFQQKYYKSLSGGIMEGLGKLSHGKTKIFVYPDRRDDQSVYLNNLQVNKEVYPLLEFLINSKKLVEIDSERTEKSIHSFDVIEKIQKRERDWQELVPDAVAEVIKKQKLFMK